MPTTQSDVVEQSLSVTVIITCNITINQSIVY